MSIIFSDETQVVIGQNRMSTRDQPKLILSVSAIAETVAKTKDTYTAVAVPDAETLGLVSAETVAEIQFLFR